VRKNVTSKLTITNQDHSCEYIAVLNDSEAATLFPLQTETLEIESGQYELSFRESDAAEVPGSCKPISFTIAEGKTLPLNVATKLFTILILDSQGNQLNGKHGFLCGQVADGVYVENPIN
jgi:hypothetical protein